MEKDIEEIIRILDAHSESEKSRLKLNVVEGEETKEVYHHGRCDIGSPWAKGEAFDVLE